MPPSEHDAREPVVTRDGSQTLYSARYGQTLHSEHGAVTEARWVFLDGSGTASRLAADRSARVLEVGFGTGLNYLVTADHARTHGAELAYTGLDRALPPIGVVAGLGYDRHLAHPDLATSLYARLAALHPDATPPTIHIGTTQLDLRIGEATDAGLEREAYDAVYHDAFSPDANPELWTEAFLGSLASALRPGGVLVTYTVKGTVRRALVRLGLEVEKRPGPPHGKREMLWARRPQPRAPAPSERLTSKG